MTMSHGTGHSQQWRASITPRRTMRQFDVRLVTSLTTIPVQSLARVIASFDNRRDDILAAIDYLFFGV